MAHRQKFAATRSNVFKSSVTALKAGASVKTVLIQLAEHGFVVNPSDRGLHFRWTDRNSLINLLQQ